MEHQPQDKDTPTQYPFLDQFPWVTVKYVTCKDKLSISGTQQPWLPTRMYNNRAHRPSTKPGKWVDMYMC